MDDDSRLKQHEILKDAVASFIEKIFQMLVDYPVSVTHFSGEQTTVFEIICDKRDLGKVLGKEGRNIGAVRVILIGVCAKIKLRSVLTIKDNPMPKL